jgi:hypothetical protein
MTNHETIEAEFKETDVEKTGGKSLAIRLTESQLEAASTSAHRYPRNMGRARQEMLSIVQLDKETAAGMLYSLPRAGKNIEGPSIRFAEALVIAWQNCATSAQIIEVNRKEGYVEAEGIYHDLQANVHKRKTVRRKIIDKSGKLFTEDMIIVTANAACSIAERNAVLSGIPRAIYQQAYLNAKRVSMGDLKELTKTRQEMISAFKKMGVTTDRLLPRIGVQSAEEITLEHVATLRGMYAALSNNEATPDEMFPSIEREQAPALRTKPKSLDDLKAEIGSVHEPTALDPFKDYTSGRSAAAAHDAAILLSNLSSEGYDAYLEGLPMKAPENYTGPMVSAWERGWQQAREEGVEDSTEKDYAEK